MNGPTRPALERLLSDAGGLRELVRCLSGDAAAAEDALQDACLLALRRPPADDRSLRGWLLRVADNARRMRARAERRRRTREQAIAAPEAQPSAADSFMRESQRRAVVEAVLALDEPYRRTLILRYWARLPAPEMARAMGVDPSTVRTRLQRGHARLRSMLEDPRGTRKAPVLLAIPVGRAAVQLAGGVLMSTTVKCVAAATVALVAGWWLLRAPGPVPQRSEVAASARFATPPSLLPAEASPDAVEREPEDVPVPGLRSIRGVVRDRAGTALPGVRVVSATNWYGAALHEVVTGSDGTFAVPAEDRVRTLTFFAARHPPTFRDDVAPGAWLDVVLDAGYVVTGRVLDARTADPLPGATVERVRDTPGLPPMPYAAGPDGRFSVPLPAGPAGLRVTLDGYLPGFVLVEDSRTCPEQVVPMTRQTGVDSWTWLRLVSATDAGPVDHARILPGPTEEHGGGLYRTQAWRVQQDRVHGEVRAPGHAWVDWMADEVASDIERPLEVRLPLESVIALQVSDASGRPIANASVAAHPIREHGALGLRPLRREESTDGWGRAILAGLMPGTRYRIDVGAPGHQAFSTRLDLEAAPARRDLGTVALASVQPLCGAAIAADDGAPIRGAAIEVSGDGPSARVESDAQGAFLVPDPPQKPWVRVEADGYLPQRMDAAAAGDEPITVRMPRGGDGVVRGTVIGPDGLPAPGARVEALFVGPRDPARRFDKHVTHAAADGTFTFDGLVPGEYDLSAERDGMHTNVSWYAPVRARPGDVVEVPLHAPGVLAWRALDADTARELLEVSILFEYNRGSLVHEQVTSSTGLFLREVLPRSPLRLAATAPGYARTQTAEFFLEPGEFRSLTLRLSREAVLEGVLLGADGAPAGGVRVRAWLPGDDLGDSQWVETTAPDGAFRFDQLSAPEVRIVLEDPAHGAVDVEPHTARLAVGRTTRQAFRIVPRTTACVRGSVWARGRKGEEMMLRRVVRLVRVHDGLTIAAEVGASNTFLAPAVPLGIYAVHLDGEGGSGSPRSVRPVPDRLDLGRAATFRVSLGDDA